MTNTFLYFWKEPFNDISSLEVNERGGKQQTLDVIIQSKRRKMRSRKQRVYNQYYNNCSNNVSYYSH